MAADGKGMEFLRLLKRKKEEGTSFKRWLPELSSAGGGSSGKRLGVGLGGGRGTGRVGGGGLFVFDHGHRSNLLYSVRSCFASSSGRGTTRGLSCDAGLLVPGMIELSSSEFTGSWSTKAGAVVDGSID